MMASKFLFVPVSEVINELEDRDEVISIAVTLPVALSLDQGLLDLGDQGLVSLHHGLELGGLGLLLVSRPVLHQRVQRLSEPPLMIENIMLQHSSEVPSSLTLSCIT